MANPNPALAFQGLGNMQIPSFTFRPTPNNPSQFVSSGLTGRTLNRVNRFVASSSIADLPSSSNVAGSLGQSISQHFHEVNTPTQDLIPAEEAAEITTEGGPAISSAMEAVEGVSSAIGEAESVVDGIPDISPLITSGAILAQGIGDSSAAAAAQDGTVSGRMEAGNINRKFGNVTNDIIAGSSIGSMLGPIGTVLGSVVSGLIGGFTSQQNTLTTSSGKDIDPSNSNVKFD